MYRRSILSAKFRQGVSHPRMAWDRSARYTAATWGEATIRSSPDQVSMEPVVGALTWYGLGGGRFDPDLGIVRQPAHGERADARRFEPQGKAAAIPQHFELMGMIHIPADGPRLIDIGGAQPDSRRDGRPEILKSSKAHI
jgi:hypothetical protein